MKLYCEQETSETSFISANTSAVTSSDVFSEVDVFSHLPSKGFCSAEQTVTQTDDRKENNH